jgi:putative transposase
MRRYIRSRAAGATFFFTVTLEDRSSRALVDNVDQLRQAVAAVRRARPFRIDAMVVLPEHIHVLRTLPPHDSDFSTRWMLVKASFTRAIDLGRKAQRQRGKGERSLWQRRFWEHQVRDEEDFARHVDYIHFNPVKPGWVRQARDWPHSSFHRYVREGKLPGDWGISPDLPGDFGERRAGVAPQPTASWMRRLE